MSIGGSRYFLTFINDYTRHTWACLIAKKSDVPACFLKVKSLAEPETDRQIKCVRSDGEKEYFFDRFSNYLQKDGIRRKISYSYTWGQNGVAERKNQTIEEVACAMLERSFTGPKRFRQLSTYKIGHLQMDECHPMSCT